MLVTVRCPICGDKSQMRKSISAIAEALLLKSVIRLHAACHDVWWDASFSERQDIRNILVDMGRHGSVEQHELHSAV